jgi:glycosyltransferase involved in cell wall biosynthesis
MISVVIISKDEAGLDDTLEDVTSQIASLGEAGEIVVVDASRGRLDYIKRRHEAAVRWVEFEQPVGVRVTIPHQRNVGVREACGDIIVFTDAGCRTQPGWLTHLVAPLRQDESAVVGVAEDISGVPRYRVHPEWVNEVPCLKECATINFAFRREAYDALAGFDENFAYGSDLDFSWRLNDAGYRIRYVADAIVQHDYGTPQRERRRSYVYGKARVRLYHKHRARRKQILRTDPMVVVYPLFLLGLPLTLIFPLYPALLLIPAWRNRSHGSRRVLVDHLWFGVGVIAELIGR